MPLLPATLASGLQGLSNSDQFPPVVDTLASAFDDYWKLASVSGIPTSGPTTVGKNALAGVLSSMVSQGGGASLIASGIVAYWGALAPLAAALWVVPGFTVIPPIIPPPGLSGLSGAISGIFTSNVQGKLPLAAAAQALATTIHGLQLGGTVTLQPTVGPPVVTPIL